MAPSAANVSTNALGGLLYSSYLGGGVKVAVANGVAANVCVYVTVDATYNGSAPYIVARANPNVGIQTDTSVVAWSSGNSRQQICGNTPTPNAAGEIELAVVINGSAGFIHVDGWSSTSGTINPNGGMAYWFNGLPFDTTVPAGAGSGHIIGGWLFNLDIDPAANDNSPAFLAKVG